MKLVAGTPFSASLAKGQGKKHIVSLCFLALFTLLQVHLLKGRAKIDHDAEAECVGDSSGSEQCYEARIFRQWHSSAAAEGVMPGEPPALEAAEAAVVTAEERRDAAELALKPAEEELALVSHGSLPSEATFDNETLHSHMHIVEALRAVSQVSADELTTTVAPAIAQDPMMDFEAVAEQVMSSDVWAAYSDTSSSADSNQVWARDLVELQTRLEGRLKTLKLLHTEPAETAGKTPLEKHAKHQSAWAQDLETLQEQLQARGTALKAKHAEHSSRRLPEMVASSSSKPEVDIPTTPIVQQIWEYGLELCKDPRRRSLASCAQFLVGADAPAKPTPGEIPTLAPVGSSDAAAQFATQFSQFADRYEQKRSTRPASQDEQKHYMHWRDVRSWRTSSSSAALRGQRQRFATVAKDDIRHAKWGGMIPKVACVSVVPYGRHIKHELKYFLDNFYLQKYEGTVELILVYHHQDLAAKKLLIPYANGVTVKVVAAMGDSKEESTAFRFGAWAAKDADIVARWDFDAWHHPSRLSSQVRAMALAKRPASRLHKWTTRSYDDESRPAEKSPADLRGEASLVGEKEWMSQYWYPTLDNEADSLSKINGKHVVEFEFPELLAYNL